MNDLAMQAKNDNYALEKIFLEMEVRCHSLCNPYVSWMLTKEDLMQQCRVEIWQAVLAYVPERGNFDTFCYHFLAKRLKSYLKVSVYRRKQQINNQAARFDKQNYDYSCSASAEDETFRNESLQAINQIVQEQLTPMEYSVTRMFYFDNHSYREIEERTNIQLKGIDNTLTRMKRKLRKNEQLQEIYAEIG